MVRWMRYVVLAAVVVLGGMAAISDTAVASSPAGGLSPSAGQYVPLAPTRIVSSVAVAANGTYSLAPRGLGGVPATGVSAVVFDLTGLGTATRSLIVYPSGVLKPATSTVNYVANSYATTSSVSAKLGDDGKIAITNSGSAAVKVWVDVVGYYTSAGTSAGSTYTPVNPARIVSAASVAAGGTLNVAPLGKAGVPSTDVTAVAVHVIARSTAAGYLTVYPSTAARPATGEVRFPSDNQYATQLVRAKLGTDGQFKIYNASAAATVVYVDLSGYDQAPTGSAASGTAFVGVTPSRIVSSQAIAAGSVFNLSVLGKGGVPTSGVSAVAFNLTASSTAYGPMIVYPGGLTTPGVSSLYYRTGGPWPVMQQTKLGTTGQIAIKNVGSVSATVRVDVVGYFKAASPPTAPTDVTGSPIDGGAVVGWTAPADDGNAAVIDYTVTSSPGGKSVTVPARMTSTQVTGLNNGQAYAFTVVARNAAGTSLQSTASDAITPAAAPPPSSPFITSAVGRDSTLRLAWIKPSVGAGSVTSYAVTLSPGGLTKSVAGDTLSADVSGLTNGNVYTATVVARSANGDSAASPPSPPVKVVAASKANAPVIVGSAVRDGTIAVRWAAPADGGATITGYRVTASPSGYAATESASTNQTSIPAPNGTAQQVSIVAITAAGQGDPATITLTAQAAHAPASPDNLRVTPGSSDGKLAVTWDAPTDDGGSSITGYRVAVNPGGQQVTSGTTSTTLTGLDPATAYSATVTAINSAGSSQASAASEPIYPKVSIKRAPIVLDAAAQTALRQVSADGVVDFEGAPSVLKNVAAGDLIVSSASTATPHGLLRRVTAVQRQSDRLRLQTVDASIDEAIAAGQYAIHQDTDAPQVAAARLNAGVKLTNRAAARGDSSGIDVSDDGLVLTIEQSISAASGGSNGFGGRIGGKLFGTLALKPNIDVDGGVGLTSGPWAKIQFAVDVKAQIKTELAAGGKFETGIPLGQVDLRCWSFSIAFVPVELCANIELRAEVNLNGSVSVTASGSFSRRLGAALRVDLDGVHPSTVNEALQPSRANVTTAGRAGIDLGFPARINVLLYDVAGPFVELTPGLTLDADIHADPWWKLKAYFAIDAGVAMHKWGLDVEWSERLLDFDLLLAQASGPFKGIAVTPNVVELNHGQTYQLRAEVLGYSSVGAVSWRSLSSGTVTSAGLYTADQVGANPVRATVTADGATLTADAVALVGPQVPSAPQDAVAESAPLSANLVWKPPADTGGDAVSSYVVQASPGALQITVPGQTTSARFDHLAPGVRYSFQVYAVNSAGASPSSRATTGVTVNSLFAGADRIDVDESGVPETPGGQRAGEAVMELSGNGRYALFDTHATSNLVPLAYRGDCLYGLCLLRKDLRTGRIDMVGTDTDGQSPVFVLSATQSSSAVISDDGNVVAYWTIDHRIIVRNLATGAAYARSAPDYSDAWVDLALSGNGTTLYINTDPYSGDYSTLDRWVPATNSSVRVESAAFFTYAFAKYDLTVSTDGRYASYLTKSASGSTTATLWDATTAAKRLVSGDINVRSAAMSDSGATLAVVGDGADGVVGLYIDSAASGVSTADRVGRDGAGADSRNISMSADGRYVTYQSQDVYSAAAAKVRLRAYQSRTGDITDVVTTPQINDNGTVYAGRIIQDLSADGAVLVLGFSPTKGEQADFQFYRLSNSASSSTANRVRELEDRITRALSSAGNGSVSAANVRLAAQACVSAIDTAQLSENSCVNLPIFFPSTADAGDAAVNDQNAINGYPAWVSLNYVSQTEKSAQVSRGWYDQAAYSPNACTGRASGTQCDEYPFYSSAQGATWTASVKASLKPVAAAQNTREGTVLSAMINTTRCGFAGQSGVYNSASGSYNPPGKQYLVVPLTSSGSPPTFFIC